MVAIVTLMSPITPFKEYIFRHSQYETLKRSKLEMKIEIPLDLYALLQQRLDVGKLQ